MKYKNMIDKDILTFLLMLFSLIIATIDAINAIDIDIDIIESHNDINDSNTDKVSSGSSSSNGSTSSHHQQSTYKGGGLRWYDVGVSLEKCSQTNHEHCLDDSMWILHPTSGFVENGKLCGIIGPSGAGKSTLLSALGGTTPQGLHLSGSIWIEEEEADTLNNSTISQRYHLSQQDGDIAMLSQHDTFFNMLTPRETLEFAAYLESQKHTNDDNRKNKYNHKEEARRKLASLGLLGVADRQIGDRNIGEGSSSHGFNLHKLVNRLSGNKGKMSRTRSGGLSGGERRRLSVALELVTNPKVFFADEPTTGLDSSQAGKVVDIISKLAKERNVPSIMSLHQPKSSIWKTLDQVILLAPGGKMCYFGNRRDAISYFSNIGYNMPANTNPAEYLIDLVSVGSEDSTQAALDHARIDLLHHQCIKSLSMPADVNNNAIVQHKQSSKGLVNGRSLANSIRRFGAILRRSWRQNIRNFHIIGIRLVAAMAQAVLFASIFTSVRDDKSLTKSIADRVALLTYGVINMSILALMKSLDLFAKERGVVLREYMRSSYSSIEYLLAKVLAEIPLDTSFALVFAWVLKSLTGLRTPLSALIKTYCLMTVTSASLGFAIGSFTSSVEAAMSTGLPIMVIFMVVGIINPSGVDLDEPPNRIMDCLSFFSPIKWAVESLVTAEFSGMVFNEKDRGFWGQLKDLPKLGALAIVKDGDNVLTSLGLGVQDYPSLMKKLVYLSGIYLSISWIGLTFFGASFVHTVIK